MHTGNIIWCERLAFVYFEIVVIFTIKENNVMDLKDSKEGSWEALEKENKGRKIM